MLQMGIFDSDPDKATIEEAAKTFAEVACETKVLFSWRWFKDTYVGSEVLDRFYFNMGNGLQFSYFVNEELISSNIFSPTDRRRIVYVYENGKWYGAPSLKPHAHQLEDLYKWVLNYHPHLIELKNQNTIYRGIDIVYLYLNEIPETPPWLYNLIDNKYNPEKANTSYNMCSKIHLKNTVPFSPSYLSKVINSLQCDCQIISVDNFEYKREDFELKCRELNLCCSMESAIKMKNNTDLFSKCPYLQEVRLYTGDYNSPVDLISL